MGIHGGDGLVAENTCDASLAENVFIHGQTGFVDGWQGGYSSHARQQRTPFWTFVLYLGSREPLPGDVRPGSRRPGVNTGSRELLPGDIRPGSRGLMFVQVAEDRM